MTKSNFDDNYKKEVLSFALFVGEMMLSNGAETYRVEDTIIRICKSRGFRHVNVFTSPTTLIISDERFDGLSFMKTVKSRSTNLNKIVLYNDFSRKFVNNPDMSVKEARNELRNINRTAYSYPNHINCIASGLASGFFALLIGGHTINNFILTSIASTFGFIIYKHISKTSSVSVFASLIASMIVATFGITFTQLGWISSPTTLIVGSIMPLLAGVAFVKGIRDLISGDLISGVAIIFEACLTSIAVATGVGVILELWIKMGGVL